MKNTQGDSLDTFIAPPCYEQIRILYQDEHLLLIDKPSGLLSLSGKNPLNKDSVHYRLVKLYPTATMVHRLDFGTSGVMVVALSKAVNAHLTKQFQARTIIKTYLATLMGEVAQDEGLIDAPIAKAEFPRQKVCRETGKPAQSCFRVLERLHNSSDGVSLTQVQFTPLTGRTHQLRVHSQSIGHPIIGCDLYGLTVNEVDSKSLAKRLMLHASCLEMVHPISGERLQIKAEQFGELK